MSTYLDRIFDQVVISRGGRRRRRRRRKTSRMRMKHKLARVQFDQFLYARVSSRLDHITTTTTTTSINYINNINNVKCNVLFCCLI